MRLLKDFDVFIQYYNIDLCKYQSFKSLQKTVGIYKMIKGKMCGVFVEDNELYLIYETRKIKVTDSCRLTVNRINNREVIFILEEDALEIMKTPFQIEKPVPYNAPFDYLNEDLEWTNFMENVINNEDKKRNFIEIAEKAND